MIMVVQSWQWPAITPLLPYPTIHVVTLHCATKPQYNPCKLWTATESRLEQAEGIEKPDLIEAKTPLNWGQKSHLIDSQSGNSSAQCEDWFQLSYFSHPSLIERQIMLVGSTKIFFDQMLQPPPLRNSEIPLNSLSEISCGWITHAECIITFFGAEFNCCTQQDDTSSYGSSDCQLKMICSHSGCIAMDARFCHFP